MGRLRWHDRDGAFVAEGYLLTLLSDNTWRLESPGAILGKPSQAQPLVTSHRSAKEAMAWAAFSESEATRRLAAGLHFALSLAALIAFVALSAEIGTLLGLALLSVAFYVMLRSAANGIGLRLHDAWGWTRLGRQQTSLLERSVSAFAERIRSRWLEAVEADEPVAVAPLEPIG